MPAAAMTWEISPPIIPAPTTPALKTNMRVTLAERWLRTAQQRRTVVDGVRVGFCVIVLCLVIVAPARAAGIQVTTTADVVTDPTVCSLRDAIAAANTNSAVAACIAGQAAPTTDVVRLGTGSYALSLAGAGEDANATGDLDVRDGGPLSIEGVGATIAGGGIDRVLHVVDQPASLSLSGVTLTGGLAPAGQSGGGVLSTGALSLRNTTVSGNAAGDGAAGTAGPGGNGGSGGGIAAAGALSVATSRLTGNRAGKGGAGDGGQHGGAGGSGGGIFAGAVSPVVLTGSLLSANTAGDGGAGGAGANGGAGGSGGGLAAATTADVRFSTFLGGVAGTGGSGVAAGSRGLGTAISVPLLAATTVRGTILVGSCAGFFTIGPNLATGGGGCPGSSAAPKLSAAGVPTAGSPAIDGGPVAGCPATDLPACGGRRAPAATSGPFEVAAADARSTAGRAWRSRRCGAGRPVRRSAVTVRNPGLAGLALPIAVTGGPDFRSPRETCPDVLPEVRELRRDRGLRARGRGRALREPAARRPDRRAERDRASLPAPIAGGEEVRRAQAQGQDGEGGAPRARGRQLPARQGQAQRPRPGRPDPRLQAEGGIRARRRHAGGRDRQPTPGTSTTMKSL